MANYIFENDSIKVNDFARLPTDFIISKDNKLKKTCYVYNNGIKRIYPTDLYDILDKRLYEIDFNKLDTLYMTYPAEGICTPDDCYY